MASGGVIGGEELARDLRGDLGANDLGAHAHHAAVVVLARHVGGALVGDVGGHHALHPGSGHVAAHAVAVEGEAERILVLEQVVRHSERGIHEVRCGLLGIIDHLVAVGDKHVFDDFLEGHALGVGCNHNPHVSSFVRACRATYALG